MQIQHTVHCPIHIFQADLLMKKKKTVGERTLESKTMAINYTNDALFPHEHEKYSLRNH